MVRFGLAASTLQKTAGAGGRRVLSSSGRSAIGTVASKAAAARLTSATIITNRSSVTPVITPSSDASSTLQYRYQSSSSSLQDRGVMDSNNLLQFATLHELQRNASDAFAPNPLFGTYEAAADEGGGGEFKWMTYEEWGQKVDACRTVLKNDCGECSNLLLYITWVSNGVSKSFTSMHDRKLAGNGRYFKPILRKDLFWTNHELSLISLTSSFLYILPIAN